MCERQAKSTTHVKSCLLSNQTVECTLAYLFMLCYFIVFGNKRAIWEGDDKKSGMRDFRDARSRFPPPLPLSRPCKYDTG